MEDTQKNHLLESAVRLASAYIKSNSITLDEIPNLLNQMCQTVADANRNSYYMGRSMATTPAVPVEDSVKDDYIICLEDGKQLQMLKRHLKTMYNMTIDQYKERWNLPADYPVVSPSYARRRSHIAKTTGLGLTGRRGRRGMRTVAVDGDTKMGVAVNR